MSAMIWLAFACPPGLCFSITSGQGWCQWHLKFADLNCMCSTGAMAAYVIGSSDVHLSLTIDKHYFQHACYSVSLPWNKSSCWRIFFVYKTASNCLQHACMQYRSCPCKCTVNQLPAAVSCWCLVQSLHHGIHVATFAIKADLKAESAFMR